MTPGGTPAVDPATGRPPKLPHKVYAGVNMSETAHLWHSETIERVVAAARARPIVLPAAGETITFGEVFELILSHGHEVYVYGGMLRDIFMRGPSLSDDVDVLFTCPVPQLVAWFEERGWRRGDFKLKTDETTGAARYDDIAEHQSIACVWLLVCPGAICYAVLCCAVLC